MFKMQLIFYTFSLQDLEIDDNSLAKVLILVTDENDNAPVFQMNHYYAGIMSIQVFKYCFKINLKKNQL